MTGVISFLSQWSTAGIPWRPLVTAMSTSPAHTWTALHPIHAKVAMDWWDTGCAHASQMAPGLIRHPPASTNTDKFTTAMGNYFTADYNNLSHKHNTTAYSGSWLLLIQLFFYCWLCMASHASVDTNLLLLQDFQFTTGTNFTAWWVSHASFLTCHTSINITTCRYYFND